MDDTRNIVLLGFMGTGKTQVGRKLAAQLDREFVDSDQAIVDREQRSIPEIFEGEGETAFRRIEQAVLRELAASHSKVIACGGGAALDPENLEILSRHGRLFCLRARPETIVARVGNDHNRPLLQGDAEGNIRRLLEERQAAYARIPYQIDTDDLDLLQIVAVIRSILDHEA